MHIISTSSPESILTRTPQFSGILIQVECNQEANSHTQVLSRFISQGAGKSRQQVDDLIIKMVKSRDKTRVRFICLARLIVAVILVGNKSASSLQKRETKRQKFPESSMA